MKKIPLTLALAASLTALAPAAAETPLTYNRVNLNETAQTEVDNDLLVAVMTARAEGRDAATPADQVNRAIDWAVNMVRSVPEIKVQTLGYSTSPIYDKNEIRGWRVSQSIRLESRDNRALGDLVARMQSELHLQSLGYEVSDEQRRRHLDGLTDTALARFQTRAQNIAKALGRKGFRIVQLHVNDSQQAPVPMVRGVMMEAAKADFSVAPARIEGGTQTMTISVNGEVELSDD
ncbi:MAG: SIMPL domain-containing protein [Gammaproteobacteria bacterium]|nr:SIMPL domain-containing protein [Gammaproteobacteria bacterium]MCB1923140.1 SIMPL domain-containing protein [Gammaproteobacteria bacterium]